MSLPTDHGLAGRVANLVMASLVVLVITYSCLSPSSRSMAFFRLQRSSNATGVAPKDELETALERASMVNKTLIIAVINKAYVEENGMLDLFLQSLLEGEDTKFLIRHFLFVAVDQTAFNKCKALELHCYKLDTDGVDFSREVFYMSENFINMMWQRTLFLGNILRRGYSFLFTDMDVMWLRNPFAKLSYDGEDMQISCDSYNGRPLDDSNFINTGFYFVASNNRTIALFDEWYASRNNSAGMKEQDVLAKMKSQGAFRQLGMKVRFLDTAYFSGFCQDSKDLGKVTTVHANCCCSVKAKLTDLKAILEFWKTFNGTSRVTWPERKACNVKKNDASKDELERALQEVSMENKTLIVAIINKKYVEKNGMLDLFLQSLREGEDTKFLIRHLLLVAVDQIAFNQCQLLKLHCYQLVTEGIDFSNEQFYMSDGFIKMMWQRTLLLGDVLRRGYNFIFTDMDVMWLRNPFAKLNVDGEDMQISTDFYNGRPFDDSNFINTGFYFVASNNRTIALFDEWYASRNNSAGMKEQDVLAKMKSQGAFRRLGMKVRFLDTAYFSGFCQDSKDLGKVTTVHANCCGGVKAKLMDLKAILEFWKTFNGTSRVTWPERKACNVKKNDASKDELKRALQEVSMENKTLIVAIINKKYVEKNGMLDLFLQSLREGEDTKFLIRHLLLVAVDQIAFNQCQLLKLHCYQLVTEGIDFSNEQFYMSDGFIKMMWQRTLLLGDVLRRGYNFIFTDMDVMWLRNPFAKLNVDGEDMQISTDFYNGRPFDDSNFINTGFYFVASNNRTIALFDEWYASRNNSAGMKEQDVLAKMKSQGAFRRLGMKVRFLDTAYFSGFCQDSKDLGKVTTVHANCCCGVKAKLMDLKAILEFWKTFNGTSRVTWPERKACNVKKNDASKDELKRALQEVSMENKTLIVAIINKKYVEKNGMLDLFLQSLREGEDTMFLIRHLLLVAVDQIAFNRCQLLKLHCYQLVTEGIDFSKEQFYMSDGFIKMMWQRTLLLGDILRRGYNFIFTDMDVMWLRNPFAKLNVDGEDMQISTDFYNGRPFDDSNFINTGFYFVASNNRTIALFDEWYASRNNSAGLKEQDVLARMKSQGAFRRLGMKVRFLDTAYFSGFCQDSKDIRKVTTVHANCCVGVKTKLIDLKAVLEVWKASNGILNVTMPEHKACRGKIDIASKDKLETTLQEVSMANKTLIIAVLNKAYTKENGMLDLFLQSLREGEDTKFLIRHLLLVAVDKTAFNRCKLLKLHCYRLVIKRTDFSREQLYMSDGFTKMMWQRIAFLKNVLKHGYSFIFTDMDVMWLRNPFTKLNHHGDDLQISCDAYNGNPLDDSNPINTGFYFVASNNKTIALFDAWYASRINSAGMKDQSALSVMKSKGIFKQLGMKVRFLDTLSFSGFCQDSRDFKEVTTVHANCCRSVKAKLADLTAVLRVWKSFNSTTMVRWPEHKACAESWIEDIRI